MEKDNGIIVLSLFDGIAGARLALKKAKIKVKKYYASEINKNAIQIVKQNWNDVIHLGDIQNWEKWDIEKPDLIIGGSPCQGFSYTVNNQINFSHVKSKLFFYFSDILNYYSPDFYLLENVVMKKEYRDVITKHIGVNPVKLNSSLVSAQSRERLYWFNWQADIPEDKNIVLRDIIEYSEHIDGYYSAKDVKNKNGECNQVGVAMDINGHDILKRVYGINAKSPTLTAVCGGNQEKKIQVGRGTYRKLSPVEYERLQNFPDNYTHGASKAQRYKCIGNSFTVDMIVYILSCNKTLTTGGTVRKKKVNRGTGEVI